MKRFYLRRVGVFPLLIFYRLVNSEVSQISKKDMLDTVENISNEIADDLGFELVDVEYTKEHGDFFLRIYVDKVNGITIDDCQIMSKKLSSSLDKADPIKREYYLEVSSPGLDRPLKTDKDLNRNLNKDVELSLYRPFKDQKKYEGELYDFDEENIILKQGENIIEIPKEYVSLTKLSIKI